MKESSPQRSGSPTGGLAERGIAAFVEIDWNGTWYSRHQITRRLARHAPVVTVSQPEELRAVLARRVPARPALEPVDVNLWTYRPPRRLPKLWRPESFANVMEQRRARHLEATLAGAHLTNPIHYVWHPEYASLLGRMRRRFTVYHCYDKFDAYEGAEAESTRRLEDRVARMSNVVIASSRILARDLEERTGRPVHHLPHGVDYEFFRDRVAGSALPEDLERIPRPRIGYVARLDERFDDEALAAIARARPAWSVVLVGGVSFRSGEGHARWKALTALPNVFALGQKPREQIPLYIAGLDVGLLCYRDDNWGRYVQPIKAYEYLACGRPVVSSPIDAAREFGPLVAVAEDVHGWVPAIEAALQDRSALSIDRRFEFARRNTWDARVAELIQLLERELGRESSSATP